MSESSVSVTFDGKNLEDLIGFISEEYECIYSGVSGKLYAGSEAVAFIGKFFLFDKKVLLKWVDVKVVQTDQGVALQTRDKNPVLHEFSGIHHPDRCWSFLVSLHNQALLDKTAAGGEDDTVHSSTNANAVMNRRKQLRRMTSDPNKMSAHIRDFFASTEEDEQGEEGKTIKSTAAIATRKSMKRSTALIEDGLQGLLNAADNMEEEERVAIETFVGKIQGLFPCMYSQQRGTLYSGSTALYFVGNRLFFCTKLMIQSKHIQQVKMLKGKNKSEQGILVSTRDGLSHDFLEMENPDQVWASLVAIRRHVGFEETKTSRHFPSLRRQNSDPNTGAGRYDLSSPSQHDETQDQKGDIAGDVAECIKQEVQPTAHATTEEELKVAWEELQNDKRRYATVVVKDHEFPCSLDVFFKSYLANNSEFGMEKYMEEKGDKELNTSSWKSTAKDGRLTNSRVVKYIHPINAPLAPPNPRARKEQTYQRYGNNGICVETSTYVDDVPMADCFYVKDRLLVVASKENSEKVLVTMEFELDFVKSTMFRGVITKTTTSEMSKFFLDMRDYMSKSLGEQVLKAKPVEKTEELMATKEPGLFGVLGAPSIAHSLLLLVIVLQFWILREMAKMKQSVLRLEEGGNGQCTSSASHDEI